MASQRGREAGGADPMRAGTQGFEAGYQSLFEGWRQAQEFWNSVAQSWGSAAGAWMGQMNTGASAETMAVLRELQEASLAVAQAWMRLPFTLMSGAGPAELQEATTRLTEAQGRAYQLWLEALTRAGGAEGAQHQATDKKG
jgi:hypothetical protein